MLCKLNLKTPACFVLLFLFLAVLPGESVGASDSQADGFILFSAGQDGQIGTGDDIYVTGKGEAVKGKVDLAALGLTQSDLLPSSDRKAEAAPAFVPASIVLTADRGSAPADGKTAVTVTAQVRGQDGGLAPDGTEVEFSATLGALSAGSAVTANGAAAVTLASGTPGTSVVTAACGGVTAQAPVEFCPLTVSFSGGQASCSGYWSAYTPDRAFDENLATLWAADTYSGWVQYAFSSPVSFSSARIVTSVSAGTAGKNSGNETVTLKVSNDGSSWTTLGTKMQPYSSSMLYREFSFNFAQVTARYVRIEIARSRDWVTVVETYLYH